MVQILLALPWPFCQALIFALRRPHVMGSASVAKNPRGSSRLRGCRSPVLVAAHQQLAGNCWGVVSRIGPARAAGRQPHVVLGLGELASARVEHLVVAPAQQLLQHSRLSDGHHSAWFGGWQTHS